MDKRSLNILLIDDDDDDYVVVRDTLCEIDGLSVALSRVDNYSDGYAALQGGGHDLCLLDYQLGEKSGLDLLRALNGSAAAPVILLTGQGSHKVDIEAMQAGAYDFLDKGRLDADTLERTIRYCIKHEHDRRVLSNTNRALAALERCNEALSKCTDEHELVREVCRVVVDIAGYRMAWVGYAEHDAEKTIRPVACEGYDEGYVDSIRAVWSDTERGRGPAGTAVRTGQAVVVRSVEDDKRFRPWREEALKREYRSLVALPLSADGEVFGILSIFCGQKNAFYDEELRLLQRLSLNLAYGIYSLRLSIEREVTRLALEEKERLLGEIVETAPSLIVLTDHQGRIQMFNRACEELTGYARHDVMGRTISELFLPEEWVPVVERRFADPSAPEVREPHQNPWVTRDGTQRLIEWRCTALPGTAGENVSIVGIGVDVTEQRRAEEELLNLMNHDLLTGLANRTLACDRLEHAMALSRRRQDKVAVLQLDLDNFKDVVDSLGLELADELLKAVGKRLLRVVKARDTVARTGGDEYCMIVEGASSIDEIDAMAQQVINAFESPFPVDTHEIYVSASIGIAVFPEDAVSVESLMKHADTALNRAKKEGRGRHLFFTSDMNEHATRRLSLMGALRQALRRGEFELHYQPQVDLATGRIIAAEALLRWRHAGELVQPGQFIGLLEESGLIVSVGEWVLGRACETVRRWYDGGLPPVRVCANLSARQIRQGDILQQVSAALDHAALDPRHLELEITESMLMENRDDPISALEGLKARGVRLSLDDFGTGYSSLSYLKRFPVDVIKIDRSFVTDITSNPEGSAIARTILSMAHTLRLNVVAEGVETEAQLNYLIRHNCDAIQGYYFSPPVTAQEFESLLAQDRRLPVADLVAPESERTVLLVDDDENILKALKRVLRQVRCRVITARNGYEGLEALGLHNVDVVISDQRMPDMNGTEFLGRVREIHPNVLRIILSGYTDLETIIRAVNEGAVYKFLLKPWDDDTLCSTVEEALRWQDLGAASA